MGDVIGFANINSNCINELDRLFCKAENRYEELFLYKDYKDGFDLAELRKKWQESPFNSPLLDIGTILGRFYRNKKLKEEINCNLLNRNIGYFEFVKNVVSIRLNFVNDHFKESLSFYFENATRGDELISMLDNGNQLPKHEFMLALQLNFIKHCEFLESLYRKYYASYESQFVPNIYSGFGREIDEPIKLNYAHNKDVAIILLHKLLYKNYIDDDLASFKAHFNEQIEKIPKIKWKDSTTLLCILFSGANLKDAHSTNVAGLKITNNALPKLICNHFCDKNSKDYVEGTLRTTICKLAKRKNTVGINPFINPLKEISRLQHL